MSFLNYKRLYIKPVISEENIQIAKKNGAEALSDNIDDETADIIKTAPGLLQKDSICSAVSFDMLFFEYSDEMIRAPVG